MKKSIYTILLGLTFIQLPLNKAIGQTTQGETIISSGVSFINYSDNTKILASKTSSPINLMRMVTPKLGLGLFSQIDNYSSKYNNYNSYNTGIFLRIYPIETKKITPFILLNSGIGKYNFKYNTYTNFEENVIIELDIPKSGTLASFSPSFGTQIFVSKNFGFELTAIFQTLTEINKSYPVIFQTESELRLDMKVLYRFSKRNKKKK